MAFTLIDGVIAHDAFATPAAPGTSQLVDGINNQAFATPASATAQPVDAVLGLTTWASGGGGPASYALTANAGTYSLTGGSAVLTKTSGSVAYSLTATAGTYALTGGTASLKIGRKITASAGTYALTGGTASLKTGRSLTASAGSYALTGGSATLTKSTAGISYALSALAGSYGLTGGTASLLVGRKLTANAGTYSLTGGSATLTKSGAVVNYSLTGNAGSYSLTGGSAALSVGRKITALAGSYSLTGGSALMVKVGSTAYTLTGDAGVYLLSGGDAVLSWSGESKPIELLGGGPGKLKDDKTSYWHRLLSAPVVHKLEELEPEVADVIEQKAAAVVEKRYTQKEAQIEMRQAMDQMGFAYTQAYKRIYLELVSEMKQAQEDETIAHIVAALI
jgi:hypothetical protein